MIGKPKQLFYAIAAVVLVTGILVATVITTGTLAYTVSIGVPLFQV